MRRTIIMTAIAGAVLLAVTACGGGTPAAESSPSPAPSPSPIAVVESPSPTPTTAAPVALTAAELKLCEAKKKPYLDVFVQRALYAGFVNGNYQGGTPAMKKVLVDVKAVTSAYHAYLKKVLPTVTSPALRAAITADIAAWAKHMTALKAAGTDYKGKVFAVMSDMQLVTGSDNQFSEACGPS